MFLMDLKCGNRTKIKDHYILDLQYIPNVLSRRLRKSGISGPGFSPSLGFSIKINFIFFWGKQLNVEYEDTSNTETCSHSSATNHFNLRSAGGGGPLHHGSVNSYLSLSDERMKERKTLQENHKVTKPSTEQSQGSG